eukprot:tig00000492_g1472.t1
MLGLPHELLARTLGELGGPEAWRLRGVCREWRDVIEAIEWRPFALDVSPAAAARLAALPVGARRPRGDFAVRLGVTAADVGAQPGDEHCERLAELLRALARSGAVVVEVALRLGPGLAPSQAWLAGLSRASRACCPARLRALRLDGAPGAAAPLPRAGEPWPAARDLRELLAPLGSLEELRLPEGAVLDPPAAEALAASAPRLRRLAAAVASAPAAAALAPLALEEVALHDAKRLFLVDGARALAALAAGRPGETLRFLDTDPCSTPERPLCVFLSGPSLRALASLRALEELRGYISFAADADRGDVAALGSLPRLRLLRVTSVGTPERIEGLCDALRASPALRGGTLDLHLHAVSFRAPNLLAPLAAAAATALRDCELLLDAPVPPALSAALAAAGPRLSRLRLAGYVGLYPHLESLLQLAPLAGRAWPGPGPGPGSACGLRLEVDLSVADAGLRAAARRALPAALPAASIAFLGAGPGTPDADPA